MRNYTILIEINILKVSVPFLCDIGVPTYYTSSLQQFIYSRLLQPRFLLPHVKSLNYCITIKKTLCIIGKKQISLEVRFETNEQIILYETSILSLFQCCIYGIYSIMFFIMSVGVSVLFVLKR